MGKILGIGWNVGGWSDETNAVVLAVWDEAISRPEFIGKNPISYSLKEDPVLNVCEFVKKFFKDENLNIRFNEYNKVIIAIDAPLGFPLKFTDLIKRDISHIDDRSNKSAYESLSFRRTEKIIKEKFEKRPQSSSFDRLTNPATLAIAHAYWWCKNENFVIACEGKKDNPNRIIIEVYPASLTPELIEKWGEWIDVKGSSRYRDHYKDACKCALLALSYGVNDSNEFLPELISPAPEDKDLAAKEGWIYYVNP